MAKGKFIVLDGPDGSGKGTEIALLKKELLESSVLFTHEPGATKRGQDIRKILLISDKTHPLSDFFLFWADRVSHVEEIIRPALNSGTHVISDRFDSSTFAYQIIADARPEFLGLFKEARKIVLRDCFPDAYIFLDLPALIIKKRIEGDKTKRTRYDIKPPEYHEKVIEGFKKFASDFKPSFMIDSDRPPKEVHDDILPLVRKILGI